MNARDTEIIEAAIPVFLRYGVKRTGMSDIAEAAGISRQTLYKSFANKDAVLQGTIRLNTQRKMQEIDALLPGLATLRDRLDLVFLKMVLEPVKFVSQSPNAEDIFEGFNASGREAIEEDTKAYLGVFLRVLEPYAKVLGQNELTVAGTASMLRYAGSGMKSQSHHADVLKEQLDTLVQSIVALCSGAVDQP